MATAWQHGQRGRHGGLCEASELLLCSVCTICDIT